MADNYLEKRYDDFKNARNNAKKKTVSFDTLLAKNRSYRGYDKSFVVQRSMLERIVGVNTKIPSARNQQVLRFRIVTKGEQADCILGNIKLGASLPDLKLPAKGCEPEAFIVICSTVPESKYVHIDLGISIQSMLLKATEMGLNGICICAFNADNICRTLNLPYTPLAILAIGKGAEKIETTLISEKESHAYYRENGIHYVPKVRTEDLII